MSALKTDVEIPEFQPIVEVKTDDLKRTALNADSNGNPVISAASSADYDISGYESMYMRLYVSDVFHAY